MRVLSRALSNAAAALLILIVLAVAVGFIGSSIGWWSFTQVFRWYAAYLGGCIIAGVLYILGCWAEDWRRS